MGDQKLFELAAANDFLVGREQIRAAGLNSAQWRRRVVSGEWVPVLPTVWCHTSTPRTWELEVRAGARWLGSHAAVAGTTAARWWGLDGFAECDAVEFVVPRGRRSMGGPAIHTSNEWPERRLPILSWGTCDVSDADTP